MFGIIKCSLMMVIGFIHIGGLEGQYNILSAMNINLKYIERNAPLIYQYN